MIRDDMTDPEKVLAVLIVVASAFFYAFVCALLWRWFVAGPFHLPAIGVGHAFGLGLLLRSLTWRPSDTTEKKATRQEKWAEVWGMVFWPLVPLLLGWAIHSWWMGAV